MDDNRKRLQFHNKLKAVQTEVNNHDTTPLSLAKAREHMTRVEEIFVKFEAIQDKLELTAADEAALKVQEASGALVETTFGDVRGKLRAIIDELSSSNSSSSGAAGATTGEVKLPRMPLMKFDGGYDSWIAFKDFFTASVGNKANLSGSQKLQYLKSSLEGKPFNLIDDITTTDSNYNEAWKILQERYDVKCEIIRAHIRKIINLKPLKSESASQLQLILDSQVKGLRSLATMGCPTDQWDALTVVMLEEKLDSTNRREWAKLQKGDSMPKWEDLVTFLNGQIRGLQVAGTSSSSNQPVAGRGDKQVKVNLAAAEGNLCVICRGPHYIQECKEFLGKTAKERSTMAKNVRLCFNCLKPDHMIKNCPSKWTCKKCNKRHHTLLHEERSSQPAVDKEKAANNVTGMHVQTESRGIVMTVVLHVTDKFGARQPCRAFVDPGATADFITEACTNRLGLSREAGCVNVTGFGDTKCGRSKGIVRTTLYSRVNQHSVDVELHVMRKLTGTLPTVKCRNGNWNHLRGLNLADPGWHQPGSVDIILGIKYYHKLMMSQRLLGPTDDAPVAWETIFGWVVAGACPVDEGIPVPSYHVDVDPIDQQVQKFWLAEEPPRRRILTQEEKKCEEHFLSTYQRNESGRFIVGVPFNKMKADLGRSRDIAYKRLLQVERRLKKQPQLQEQYVEFMREYESLGHMSRVGEPGEVLGVTNYLCHHFVTNESSSTTKLRVVFDGSAATTTGVSLNEAMLVGATLQDDLFDLLLRFRVHPVVLKADMAKMFRQFKLREEDANFHRILWRDAPEQPVVEYQLNTITYGTACAPNLSTRCVQQLGFDCADKYPEASKTLLTDTYIDDILTGRSTAEQALSLYHELQGAVATAGLELRKWISNDTRVMESIPEELRESNQVTFDDGEMVKALGVQWQPKTDQFSFKTVKFDDNSKTTKRSLLSELARVFDPLGLVSCVTLRGKLLLQELWRLPIGWDEQVPEFVEERWNEYKADLSNLHRLSIPRRITISTAEKVELHGFADSSESGYGGIVYLRSVMPDGSVEVRFVTSKTRVAPVRQVTLPRLELCAAVLVAELIVHVRETLKLEVEMHLWSDSTITLTWIAASPRRWKTFIANRVAAIQELTPVDCWRHVAGIENPADLASRGCSVEDLCNSQFWWTGPDWLHQHVLPNFPEGEPCGDMEERQAAVVVHHVLVEESPVLQRFSSLTKLKRLTAWHLRFLRWKLAKKVTTGPLQATELHDALLLWVRKTQQQWFKEELTSLRKNGAVGNKSKLKGLFPFIDNRGILRLSGRLRNAPVSSDKSHQIILPGDCHLSTLIIRHFHELSLHGGFQITWSSLQVEFWLLRGRDRVRHHVRRCVRCRQGKSC